MKKSSILLALMFWISMSACEAQTQKENPAEQPKITTRVNKEYDENGNLIRYDSLYTYEFHSGNLSPEQLDSIFHAFQPVFNQHFNRFEPQLFHNFGHDSLFFQQFFTPDFFQQQFMKQDSLLLEMMKEMDRIKNEFYFPPEK